MKCRCIDKDCLTVAEAVDVIERYESIVGDPSGNNRKQNLRARETKTMWVLLEKREIQIQETRQQNILTQESTICWIA